MIFIARWSKHFKFYLPINDKQKVSMNLRTFSKSTAMPFIIYQWNPYRDHAWFRFNRFYTSPPTNYWRWSPISTFFLNFCGTLGTVTWGKGKTESNGRVKSTRPPLQGKWGGGGYNILIKPTHPPSVTAHMSFDAWKGAGSRVCGNVTEIFGGKGLFGYQQIFT